MNSGEDDAWEWHMMDAPGFELPDRENLLFDVSHMWVMHCVLLNSTVKVGSLIH